MWVLRSIACAIVLVVTARAIAAPSPESVVVATDDPAFRVALAEALEPAGISIVTRDGITAPALAEIAAVSRTLADDAHATATVWLVATPGEATLVAYDRGVDRVLVRTLPFGAPLTPARAAESARMARTMLRALRVTPDTDLMPPRASEAAAVRARPISPSPAPAPPRAARLATSFAMGLRVGAAGRTIGLAAEAGAVWRPDALGVAVTGSYAPPGGVAVAMLSGSVHDDAIAALARWPVRLGERGRVVALGGAALHVVALRGTLPSGASADETSLDPALRVGALGAWALDRTVEVGLEVSADYLLTRQRYEFDAAEVLVIPRFQLVTGVFVALRLL
jgi:hypothetical protein